MTTAGQKHLWSCKQLQHTLAAVQAQLPRVRQRHDQGRVAALAGVLQQLLRQVAYALHAGVGPTVVGLRLEGLQAAHGPQSVSARHSRTAGIQSEVGNTM